MSKPSLKVISSASTPATRNPERIQQEFARPMTIREWDNKYPGALDNLGILAAAANVIMQLARPGVGRGVLESRVESGSIFAHPIKRARTTLSFLTVATLGTTEEKLAYRQAINRSHKQVHSTKDSPVEYHAMDPELQLWVAACLAWGLADTLEKLRGPMPRKIREQLYQDLEVMGTTLQVRPGMWPKNLDEFEQYWENGLKQVSIDPEVRKMLNAIADVKFMGKAVSKLTGRFNRFLTNGFLPAPIREEMHWEWTPKQQKRFDTVMKTVGSINRLMPLFVRTAGYRLVMWDLQRRIRNGQPLV